MEVAPVQTHHDVAVPQTGVVRLELTYVLELALRHGSGGAAQRTDQRTDQRRPVDQHQSLVLPRDTEIQTYTNTSESNKNDVLIIVAHLINVGLTLIE